MVGAGNLANVKVRGRRPKALEKHLARAKLVVTGKQQQAALGHTRDRLARVGLDRQRDEGAPLNPRLARRNPTHGPRPKRKAPGKQRQPREAPLDLVQRRNRVAFLEALAVVLAFGLPDAAKVKPQHRQPGPAQPLGRPKHDRIVHRAPVRGVRMAHDRRRARRRIGVAVALGRPE